MFTSTVRPARAAQCARSQNAVVARATAVNVERRDVLAFVAGLPVLAVAGSAQALIPDDDDEQLVEKAKANRKKKLAEVRSR